MRLLRSAEGGSPSLREYLDSQDDVVDAINGAIMYHGTRVLGQAVKRALTSEVGSLEHHEGVVLRGLEDFLVKLTGDFIVQGLASAHGGRGHMLHEEEKWAPTDPQRVSVIAGGFKPPHRGHLQMVQHYADLSDRVKLFIGSNPRSIENSQNIITAQQSVDIWKQYLEDAGLQDKVEVEIIQGSPMKAAYTVLEDAEPGQTIIMGCGQKDTYYSEAALAKYTPEGVTVEVQPCPNIVDKRGNPYKAEHLRATINAKDVAGFEIFLPKKSLHRGQEIFDSLLGSLDEESGAGAVGGSMAGPGGGAWSRRVVKRGKRKTKEKTKLTERRISY